MTAAWDAAYAAPSCCSLFNAAWDVRSASLLAASSVFSACARGCDCRVIRTPNDSDEDRDEEEAVMSPPLPPLSRLTLCCPLATASL